VEDSELLDQMRAGNEKAFTELVARYQSLLVRIAQFYVNSAATAEDVAQETWIAVIRGVEKFEGRSSFKTWLLHILVNRARSTGSREHRSTSWDSAWTEESEFARRFDQRGMWQDPPTPFTDVIEDGIVNEPIVRSVHAAIGRLPDVQRTVVTLRDVEGLSTTEVATLLDLSEPNVRVILHRGRSRIRSEVENTMRGSKS
jgi:RNA polymerase sigma-70 factor (ECF subfamily)